MTASALDIERTTRAVRLRAHTHHHHEKLDGGMMNSRPFESRERYGMFLQVQHPFLRQVDGIYKDPALNALIPDLAQRARFDLIEQDAVDLGVTIAPVQPLLSPSMGESLGWLYVAEGSNLGAAILLKAAQKLDISETFGARHLAGHPDGRGLNWRRFIAHFDAIALSAEEERQADKGAADAFRYVQDRVTAIFG